MRYFILKYPNFRWNSADVYAFSWNPTTLNTFDYCYNGDTGSIKLTESIINDIASELDNVWVEVAGFSEPT